MNNFTSQTLLLGAVAYDPKVVTIWEGLRDYFNTAGVALDVILFGSYERQVDFLIQRKIDIAWNTPLAHVRVKQLTQGSSLALGMRDSDRDFHARLIVRKSSGIKNLHDLAGKKLAVGSRDSTQARILPLHFLQLAGVNIAALELLPFDTDVGKHGDTGTSELEVLKALADGRADAGVIGDLIWLTEQAAGRVNVQQIESIWTTPGFDHCMFDALADGDKERFVKFSRALYAMSWDNPMHRRLLELEGLRRWLPAREEGYASLHAALKNLGELG